MKIFFSLLFISTCTAGAVAADSPAVVLGMPDPGRTAERFALSFFGKAWLSPDNAPVRDLVAGALHFSDGTTLAQITRIDAASSKDGFTLSVVSPTRAEQLAEQFALVFTKGHGWTTAVSDGVLHVRQGEHPPLPPVAGGAADLTLAWNLASLAATVSGPKRKTAELLLQALPPGTGDWTLVPEGIATHVRFSKTSAALLPLERAAFAAVPADVVAVQAIGLDGAAWWAANKQWGADLLRTLNVERPLGELLAAAGLPAEPTEVFSAFHGTMVMAVRDGSTMPAVTLLLPRNAQLDRLVEMGLQALGCPMPGVGSSTPLLVAPPGMNEPDRQRIGQMVGLLGISIGRTTTTWVWSSDALLSGDILAGTAGGWVDSPLGKAAMHRVDAQTCFLTATDGQRAFRSMVQYASMFAGQLPDRNLGAAVVKLAVALARGAGPGYVVGRRDGTSFVIEGRGPGLDLLFPGGNPGSMAIIAAIAVPKLLESRVTANEASAASTLRSGVFPGEIQFQAGAYIDENNNGRGEYGFLSELSGGPVPGFAKTLSLMAPHDWNAVRNGYHFTVYLPDGMGGARDQRTALNASGTDDREGYFVAYAWPEKDQGFKIFAVFNHGTVYQLPVGKGPATQPAWNDVFGGEGKTWTDKPSWQRYQR